MIVKLTVSQSQLGAALSSAFMFATMLLRLSSTPSPSITISDDDETPAVTGATAAAVDRDWSEDVAERFVSVRLVLRCILIFTPVDTEDETAIDDGTGV